ncbi:uncharacterized protein METZ01_LOCUS266518 [marine metagenome]|uniref:Uncharacterized protein n=1 Tax=marine metagenome TaxID=408172 RepID=A0A382JMJ6_9ZZZZ
MRRRVHRVALRCAFRSSPLLTGVIHLLKMSCASREILLGWRVRDDSLFRSDDHICLKHVVVRMRHQSTRISLTNEAIPKRR